MCVQTSLRQHASGVEVAVGGKEVGAGGVEFAEVRPAGELAVQQLQQGPLERAYPGGEGRWHCSAHGFRSLCAPRRPGSLHAIGLLNRMLSLLSIPWLCCGWLGLVGAVKSVCTLPASRPSCSIHNYKPMLIAE